MLRRHAQLLLALFALLLKTGIPELTEPEDIDYVRNALALDLTEEAAERHFEGLIDECLEKSWATQVNFWFPHIYLFVTKSISVTQMGGDKQLDILDFKSN